MSRRTTLLAMFLSLMLLPAAAMAQDAPRGGGGGGGNGGDAGGGGGGGRGGRNFDPQQMRDRFEQNIKEQMGATDDEWKVLQPKIEKVFTAQRDARGGGFGFGGGFRRGGQGGGGGGDNQPQSPVAKASQDLRDALQNKDV